MTENQIDAKISELENRLAHVERIVGLYPTASGNVQRKEFFTQDRSTIHSNKSVVRSVKAITELNIGKYVLHVIAVLLVFYAVTMFVMFVWNKVGVEGRIGIVELLGASCVSLGIVFRYKFNIVVTSFLLGAGAGSTYLGIAFAYIWKVVPEYAVIFALVVWLILFMAIYRITKVFFVVVTSFIGVIVAFLQLSFMLNGLMDVIVFALFVTTTTLMILVCTVYKNTADTKVFATIVMCAANALFAVNAILINGDSLIGVGVCGIVIQAVLFLVLYMMHKLFDDTTKVFVGTSAFICLLTLSYIPMAAHDWAMSLYIGNIVMCLAMGFAFRYNNWLLVFIYTVSAMISVGCVAYIEDVRYDAMIAIPAILLLLHRSRLMHVNHKLMSVMLIISTVSGFVYYMHRALRYLFNALGPYTWIDVSVHVFVCIVCVFFAILVKSDKESTQPIMCVTVGVLLCNMLNIGTDVSSMVLHEYADAVRYAFVAPALIVVAFSGILKDVNDVEFKWFSHGLKECQRGIKNFWYVISMLIYITGIGLITDYSYNEQLLPYVISLMLTLGVMATQTVLTRNAGWSIPYQIVTGAKLSVFVYAALYHNVGGIVLSIIGVAIAALFIWSGFNFRLKGLRLYGLILMILAVIKAILFDTDVTSVGKILAIVVGAFICIFTSYMYNKFEKVEKRES
jgi:hypothetical protein